MKKVEQLIDSVAEYGGVAASAGIGALIGTAIAGPAGSVGGALIGTVAERTILKIGQEIKDRCLSTSEVRKIGSVYDCVKEKINENLTVGKPLRNDDFFDESFGDRSSSDEILEGVLFAAQRESEEKKLTYMASLYANIVFDSSIDRQMANQLIKIASELTYRQLVILSVICAYQDGHITNPPRLEKSYNSISGLQNVSIATEIYDLYRRSLLFSSDAILDAAGINPSLLAVNGLGNTLHQLMELFTIPSDDLYISIVNFLSKEVDGNLDNRISSAEMKVTAVFG